MAANETFVRRTSEWRESSIEAKNKPISQSEFTGPAGQKIVLTAIGPTGTDSRIIHTTIRAVGLIRAYREGNCAENYNK